MPALGGHRSVILAQSPHEKKVYSKEEKELIVKTNKSLSKIDSLIHGEVMTPSMHGDTPEYNNKISSFSQQKQIPNFIDSIFVNSTPSLNGSMLSPSPNSKAINQKDQSKGDTIWSHSDEISHIQTVNQS